MPTVLSSWKEIAQYLNKGVRTVQRWERDLGLPVRRPKQSRKGVVLALVTELDTWLQSGQVGDVRDSRSELTTLREQVYRLQKKLDSLQTQNQSLHRAVRALMGDEHGQPATVGAADVADELRQTERCVQVLLVNSLIRQQCADVLEQNRRNMNRLSAIFEDWPNGNNDSVVLAQTSQPMRTQD